MVERGSKPQLSVFDNYPSVFSASPAALSTPCCVFLRRWCRERRAVLLAAVLFSAVSAEAVCPSDTAVLPLSGTTCDASAFLAEGLPWRFPRFRFPPCFRPCSFFASPEPPFLLFLSAWRPLERSVCYDGAMKPSGRTARGISISSKFSISRSEGTSRSPTNVTALPSRPARAVRPMRCT